MKKLNLDKMKTLPSYEVHAIVESATRCRTAGVLQEYLSRLPSDYTVECEVK